MKFKDELYNSYEYFISMEVRMICYTGSVLA